MSPPTPAPDGEDPAGSPPALALRRRVIALRAVMVLVTLLALVLLVRGLAGINLRSVVTNANRGWILVAAAASVFPVLGSALALLCCTPGRLPFPRTVVAQLATSFLNVVVPSGAGAVALNVRFLQRRGLGMARALVAVGAAQTTSLLTTFVLIVALLLSSGRSGQLHRLVPSAGRPVVLGLLIVALVAALALVLPRSRRWLLRSMGSHLSMVGPQLRATFTSPYRVLGTVAGHLLVTLGLSTTLSFVLRAYGGRLSLVSLVLVIVASSAIGGSVPSPGGLGAVEVAIGGALLVVGVPAAAAWPVAIAHRLVTFWARVPIGWLALLWLRRRDAV